jgi:hypothetical protein
MKKMSVRMLVLYSILLACFVSACGSSNGNNSSQDETPQIDESLVGKWTSNYTADDGSAVIETWTFENNGSFTFHASETLGNSIYECTNKGTWTVKDGLINFTNTYVSDPNDDETGTDELLYYYFTSNSKLALRDGGDIFFQNSVTPNSYYGEWKTDDEDSDCNTTLILNDDAQYTWSIDQDCIDPSYEKHIYGTYSVNDDMIVLSDPYHINSKTYYYELFSSTILVPTPEDRLFTKN